MYTLLTLTSTGRNQILSEELLHCFQQPRVSCLVVCRNPCNLPYANIIESVGFDKYDCPGSNLFPFLIVFVIVTAWTSLCSIIHSLNSSWSMHVTLCTNYVPPLFVTELLVTPSSLVFYPCTQNYAQTTPSFWYLISIKSPTIWLNWS